MNQTRLGIAAAVATADALLLLIGGASMMSAPPSPADAAVGKGLLVLGVAVAVPALVLLCWWTYLKALEEIEPEPARSRNDWEDA